MYSYAPDTLGAVASYVEREYGYGYRIEPLQATLRGGGIFEVSHFDGSRFKVTADQWANVERMPDLVGEQQTAAENFFKRAATV